MWLVVLGTLWDASQASFSLHAWQSGLQVVGVGTFSGSKVEFSLVAVSQVGHLLAAAPPKGYLGQFRVALA